MENISDLIAALMTMAGTLLWGWIIFCILIKPDIPPLGYKKWAENFNKQMSEKGHYAYKHGEEKFAKFHRRVEQREFRKLKLKGYYD